MTARKVMITQALIDSFKEQQRLDEEHKLYRESQRIEDSQKDPFRYSMSATKNGRRVKMHWGGK